MDYTPSVIQETYTGAGYTDDEVEFMLAIERYKRLAHRPFPTWHEVLRVLLELGYRKPLVEPKRIPKANSD